MAGGTGRGGVVVGGCAIVGRDGGGTGFRSVVLVVVGVDGVRRGDVGVGLPVGVVVEVTVGVVVGMTVGVVVGTPDDVVVGTPVGGVVVPPDVELVGTLVVVVVVVVVSIGEVLAGRVVLVTGTVVVVIGSGLVLTPT
ncbi:hypothetical protein [Nocardia aurantiaca]|uniref:Uncharacterized protein n=1 Tax=Nocardia aurantiaca TaxID=2675850 RepID=A0A6I3L5J6_9NOCA|nr:hypothetical protein [Nocardia aurantiaca]MTE16781.1 hypothetical protein [Nocardia aurantiaca]